MCMGSSRTMTQFPTGIRQCPQSDRHWDLEYFLWPVMRQTTRSFVADREPLFSPIEIHGIQSLLLSGCRSGSALLGEPRRLWRMARCMSQNLESPYLQHAGRFGSEPRRDLFPRQQENDLSEINFIPPLTLDHKSGCIRTLTHSTCPWIMCWTEMTIRVWGNKFKLNHSRNL